MPYRFQIVRDIEASSYFESFLVSGVSALIVIRVYLELTGE